MVTAGYDPADILREYEQREHDWEMTRPTCQACGDRILSADRYDIGGYKICEDCIGTAWNVIQKNAHRLFFEEYGGHSDYLVIEAIVERMLEVFDLTEFMHEIEEGND